MTIEYLKKQKKVEEAYHKLMSNPIQTWDTGWTVFLEGEWKLLNEEFEKRARPLIVERNKLL